MSLPQTPSKNRNTVLTSASIAVAYDPPIGFVMVRSAGNVVLKDEAGTSVTFNSCKVGDVLSGPFSAFTSTTCAVLWLSDAQPVPCAAETSIAGLYVDAQTAFGVIDLPLGSFNLFADGTPLAVWADATTTTPGVYSDGAKTIGIRWNNDAAPAAIMTSFAMPPDVDLTVDAVLHIRAAKTNATNNAGNTPTFVVTAANQVDGALYDADTNFGGTSSAMLPAATAKTIQSVTRTLALADLAAYPASVSLSIKPTAGTLNTDDLVLVRARIVYKRKLLTS